PPTGPNCDDGYKLYGGFCIPSRETCNLCTTETCNGRDDDCDGQPDNGLTCTGRVLECPAAGEGCASDERCAGISCVKSCETDDDCTDGQNCESVKDRYGASSPTKRGCATNPADSCKRGCQMLASTMPDAEMQDFITCMDDGNASCNLAFNCAQKLPINF
ncbi:MAG: hypothetical protein MUF54_21740, partial [Polyangiaceae bacterium]|nr:hypothetical protein [Polyangiaceae bacterium]